VVMASPKQCTVHLLVMGWFRSQNLSVVSVGRSVVVVLITNTLSLSSQLMFMRTGNE
jgi:uncharacterized membrane protein YccC